MPNSELDNTIVSLPPDAVGIVAYFVAAIVAATEWL